MTRNVTDNIAILLKKYPKLVHDDKRFVAVYWKEIQGLNELNEDFMDKATSPETLCRMKRRYLQRLV